MSSGAEAELSAQEQSRLAEIAASPLQALRQFQDIEQKFKAMQFVLAKFEEDRRLDRARRFGASSEAGDDQANLFDMFAARIKSWLADVRTLHDYPQRRFLVKHPR